MIQCSECGTNNIENNKFCLQCGSKLVAMTGMMSSQTIIGNRYSILEKVGQGGMGAVYKALDKRLDNAVVAIKEMSSKALPGGDIDQTVESFKREASILTTLRHSALPRVTDFFSDEEGERWYLVMDFIEGETLQSVIERRGKITEAEVINWAYQIMVALDYLHHLDKPIIIRDLKPANIMLTATNEIKLIDFGIARHFKGQNSPDSTFLGYGSQGFSPPEQYGEGKTDVRSDLYSLGATLHYLLSGIDPIKIPFQFADLTSLGVSVEMNSAIQKAVQFDPEKRPGDVREMMALFPEPINTSEENAYTELLHVTPNQGQDKTRALSSGIDHAKFKEQVSTFKKTSLKLSISVLIIAILAGGGVYIIKKYQEDYYLKQASIYLQKANYEEAKKLSTKAIENNPRMAEAYAVRAAAYVKLGENGESIEDCDEAIRLQPDLVMPYYVQGSALNKLGNHKKAKEQLMQAVQLNPKEGMAYIYLAEACNGLKDYNSALNYLGKAESLDIDMADYYLVKAQTYNHLFRPDQARINAQKAIEISPQFTAAYLCLSEANYMLYEFNDALDNAEQALQLDSRSPLAYVLKAEALNKLYHFEDALAECQKALEIDPNFARAYSAQGHIECNKYQKRDIIESIFQKAIDLDSSSAQYHADLAEFYSMDGYYPDAIAKANTAIKLDSQYMQAYVIRGRSYRALNMDNKALEDLNNVIAIAPVCISAYIERALIYRTKGEYEKALSDYDFVLKNNDKIVKVYLLRGYCYYEMENYEMALEMYNKAIELDPLGPDGFYYRADLYREQGLSYEARKDENRSNELRTKRYPKN